MVNFRWLNTHAKIKIILIVKTKKINTMKEFFIGIDVSKRTLDCVLYDSDNRKMGAQNHKKITNNQDGCDMLMAWIKEQGINKRKLLVCMEHTGEPSYYFARLLEKRMQDFTLIPAMLIKSAFAGERGKNDKVDAILIARYAHLHRENLMPTHLKDDKILRIKGLMNDRAMAIKCRTMYKNIMSEVRDVVSEFRHKNAERNVAYFDKQVSEIEKEIKHLIHSNEELEHTYRLVTSVTSISFVNAINFIIYTNNFTNFDDCRKYAAYVGVAPYEHMSGTSINKGTHVSKMANKIPKSDLSMAAKSAIQHDPDLKGYYQRKRAEGKSFGCALNAVKFKLISRVFAVIKRGTPYVNIMKYAS